jgi:hypothetical protein
MYMYKSWITPNGPKLSIVSKRANEIFGYNLSLSWDCFYTYVDRYSIYAGKTIQGEWGVEGGGEGYYNGPGCWTSLNMACGHYIEPWDSPLFLTCESFTL